MLFSLQGSWICIVFSSPYFHNIIGHCTVGDIRLVGGETEMEGRVEVCRDGYSRWGTVCNRQWTVTHSKVVCRNLGFSESEGIIQSLIIILNLHIQLVSSSNGPQAHIMNQIALVRELFLL